VSARTTVTARAIGIGAAPLTLRQFPSGIVAALAFVLATLLLVTPLHAQGRGGGGSHGGSSHGGGGGSHGGGSHGGGGSWHGGGGSWHGGGHSWRGGHGGHGGVFFNFGVAAPYYPYYYDPYPSYPYYYPPAYYAPPAYYGAAPAQSAPMPAPTPSWYYCDNPQGYYPYVTSCAGGWREVPAKPQ
jgi:hypothetical protein